VDPSGLYVDLGSGNDRASRRAEEGVIGSALGIVSMFLSAFGGRSQQVASVLKRANVAKPLRVSALLTSQHTGDTSECKPL